MQALILAGGKGTRLRPLTVYTPKPVVSVVNRPFLLYQIDLLKKAGIIDITLSLSYQPDKIQQLLGSGIEYGVTIRYISEPTPLGTGGAYRFAMREAKEPTVVLNGDILTDVNIANVIGVHKKNQADVTIAVAPVEDPSRFGVVTLDKTGSVTSFDEKPEGMSSVNTVNAGIYVLEPVVSEMIDDGAVVSFERDVFPRIIDQRRPFFAYVMKKDYWRDIGTAENYLGAHYDLLAGRVRDVDIVRGAESEVATRSEVDHLSVIAEGCVIKAGSRIINSVIGKGVLIEEHSTVENSVIWPHTRVLTAAEVRNSVVGRGCHIGRSCIVENAMLGDKTSLTDYTRT
jgi:NDP-sugar pyrophosphorylase family protein